MTHILFIKNSESISENLRGVITAPHIRNISRRSPSEATSALERNAFNLAIIYADSGDSTLAKHLRSLRSFNATIPTIVIAPEYSLEVFRKMKALLKRVQKHAQRHLDVLKVRGEETDLSPGVIQNIITQMEGILAQVPTVIKQAHERIIGGRKVLNKDKIFSLYDEDVQVIVRGKSNAEVEFGNNLWIGENRSGFIVDYLLDKEKISDAKQVGPAIKRLVEEQSLQIKSVCGDRGLHSAANEEMLKSHGIDSWLQSNSPSTKERISFSPSPCRNKRWSA